MPQQPPTPTPVLRIPELLRQADQWVLWRKQNDTKVPYSAHSGKAASSTKREDWVTFDEAFEAYRKRADRYAGLGFVFAADDPFCGIDLDDCITAEKKLKPWAIPILEALYSYAEISPSGNGIKIWVRAKLPAAGTGLKININVEGQPDPSITKKTDPRYNGAIEMYDHGRYFTVTGRVLKNAPLEIEDRQDAVTELYMRLRKAVPAQQAPASVSDEIPDSKVIAGGRHDYLVKVAAQLRAKGFGPVEITAALRPINQCRCDPPKTERELDGIVKWVCDRPAGELPELPREEIASGSEKPPEAEPATEVGYLPRDAHEKLYPNDIARLIMRDHAIIADPVGLIYEYNGLYWRQTTDKLLLSYALSYDTHQHTKRSRRSEVVGFILDASLRRDIAWRNLAPAEVACRNGVVNVTTCEVRPHRKEDYLECVIPHDYDPRQHPHLWQTVLERWFRGDEDAAAKINALQEFFGYCLLPHARYKKALFLYGESDTGKSVVPIILGHLVGLANRCTLSTDQMADERKRAPIVGKMVNLLTELPAEAMIADGGFKQLVSTGDPISIDPKYKEPFDYVPVCKHIVCCNNLPTINDLSRATFNRLLLIQFNHVLTRDEQDKNLIDKLCGELTGILAWAVEGADRLIQNNGEFTRIDESTEAVAEYRRESNPINEFIAEKCRIDHEDEDARIPASEFREKLSKWMGKPITPRGMASMIRSAGYRVEVQKFPRESGRPTRCVISLTWLP
jgi:P4 family phage/plasmid primase-like protien